MISSLHLPYSPKADEIPDTAFGWFEIITKKQGGMWVQGDGERLKIGFDELKGDIDRWPAPKTLLDKMPPRKARPALSFDPRTEEDNQEGLVKIRQILASLDGKFDA